MGYCTNKISRIGIIFNIKNNTVEHIKYIYSLYIISYINRTYKDRMLSISDYNNRSIIDISKHISTTGRFFYFKNHMASKIKNVSLNNMIRFHPSLSSISKNNPGSIINDIKKKALS